MSEDKSLSMEEFTDAIDDIDLLDTGLPKENNPEKEQAESTEPKQDSTEVTEAEEGEDSSDEDDILADLDEEDEDADDTPEDESETDEDESDDEADQTEHTVKIDGEEHTVTLDELKKGYGLQQSLTRKGQEIADERKKLDEETQAVAWVKASPERKQLQDQINEANEAITRGYVLDANGEAQYLTKEQIAKTQENINNAVAEFNEKNIPPRLTDLQEKVPVMFGEDTPEKQAKLDSYSSVLNEFGYSQPEITALDDPRTFLMMEELLELRGLAARVEKAKARKSEKTGIVKRPTKSKSSGLSTSKPHKSKKSDTDIVHDINAGDADPSDLFSDIDF